MIWHWFWARMDSWIAAGLGFCPTTFVWISHQNNATCAFVLILFWSPQHVLRMGVVKANLARQVFPVAAQFSRRAEFEVGIYCWHTTHRHAHKAQTR